MRSGSLGWKILSILIRGCFLKNGVNGTAAQSYQRTQERVDAVNSMFNETSVFGNVVCRWGVGASGHRAWVRWSLCPVDRHDLHAAIYVYGFAPTVLCRSIIRKIDAEVNAVEDYRPASPLHWTRLPIVTPPLGEKSAGWWILCLRRVKVFGDWRIRTVANLRFSKLFWKSPEYSGTIEVHESGQTRDLRDYRTGCMPSLGLLARIVICCTIACAKIFACMIRRY